MTRDDKVPSLLSKFTFLLAVLLVAAWLEGIALAGGLGWIVVSNKKPKSGPL